MNNLCFGCFRRICSRANEIVLRQIPEMVTKRMLFRNPFGVAASRQPTDLWVANFGEPGTLPAAPGYAGE
jgi:hypothetical protein